MNGMRGKDGRGWRERVRAESRDGGGQFDEGRGQEENRSELLTLA